jgi:tetratricopeptide (TPR) repeat protein
MRVGQREEKQPMLARIADMNAAVRRAGRSFRDWIRRPRSWHGFSIRIWRAAAYVWKASPQFILTVVTVTAFAAICILLIADLTERAVAINPISVPSSLNEKGITPEVASRRLGDEMHRLHRDKIAHAYLNDPQIANPADEPKVVVPTTGLSLDTVASAVRKFIFTDRRPYVSGEITISGGQLWLRLRMNGREFYHSDKGVNPESLDDLLAMAAPAIYEETQPYGVAAWQYESDKKGYGSKALDIVDRALARLPPSDHNIVGLYNLKGAIYHKRQDYAAAEEALNRAIKLDPTYSYAYVNLGWVQYDENQAQSAMKSFYKAIELDPHHPEGHNNVGWILYKQKKFTEASDELRKAIAEDPKFAMARRNLALVLGAQGKPDEALREAREAIKLDPELSAAHETLGELLIDQKQTAAAIDEYREAIRLDPNNEPAKIRLKDATERSRTNNAAGPSSR